MTHQLQGENLPRLVQIMQRLLAPGGCPWDREQTLETLRAYVIEEAFEVVDAIDSGDSGSLKEELGDLLLQVVFQAELARDKGWFGPNDVIESICDKLVRRHPHVFGELQANDSRAALQNWEAIKAQENGPKGRGRLDGVPLAMPALLRAFRIGEKAAQVGYDWSDAAHVRVKVNEELSELDAAIAYQDLDAVEAELGDVLFAVASLARKHGLDPEMALRKTLQRFTERFGKVEARAKKEDRELASLTDAERDVWWQEAKRDE